VVIEHLLPLMPMDAADRIHFKNAKEKRNVVFERIYKDSKNFQWGYRRNTGMAT
jgi:hypothetical protein